MPHDATDLLASFIARAQAELDQMRRAVDRARPDQTVTMALPQFQFLIELIAVLTDVAALTNPEQLAPGRTLVSIDYVQDLERQVRHLEQQARWSGTGDLPGTRDVLVFKDAFAA